ncbi:FAD-dependent oxidoreductase [Geitlerinema splendidum]|nr:FAD-dependent oxidoreductase [Geitlerinema splendidum]
MNELACDILIVGGGTGGTAAALALADKGLKVVLTEPTDWIGGQLTSQAVPPDEHPWIEQCGCTRRYRHFREMVRATYRRDENLTDEARRNFRLNPGGGWVSHLCHSPAVGHRVLQEMLKPALHSGLTLLLHHQPVSASVDGDEIKSVTLRNTESDSDITVWAKFF